MKLGLSNKLWFLLLVVVTMITPIGSSCTYAQKWTGGGDKRDWNDGKNWDATVTASSNLVFDATGIYLDKNNDNDIDLRFGKNFTVNSVTISGDYTANLQGGPANSHETHIIAGDGNARAITIGGSNANGHAIEYTPPSAASNPFDHNLQFDAGINFLTNASIRNNSVQTTGPSQQLQFNRGISASGQNLTFSTGANNVRAAIQFTETSLSRSNWANTVISEGMILLSGGVIPQTLDLGTGTVTMSSVGASSIVSNPGSLGSHTMNNNIVIGSAGNAALRVFGGSTETFTLTGNISSAVGSTQQLKLDVGDQDRLVFTGDIDVGGQLYVGASGAAANTTFDGTISGADGGVRFVNEGAGDGLVDGTGTIKFAIDSAVTTGAANYGGLAWDVEQGFNIDNFTVDFSLTNGPLTELAYILIDYSHLDGLLAGTNDVFSTVNSTPIGYELDYQTNDQIRLVSTAAVPEPTALTFFGFWAIGVVGRRRRRSLCIFEFSSALQF